MSRAADTPAEIERLVSERIGRPCLLTPSGRIAIHLALTHWLAPGARLLMSPVNDDVVFFTVLAAGMRPVMAPVSSGDGNIDVAAVPDHVWPSLDGVLTTNLYGLPDRVAALRERCDAERLVLIEDAAHGMGIEADGRPLGSVGDVAAFSLSKHVRAGGGLIAWDDEARRPELARSLEGLLRPWPRQPLARLDRWARTALAATGLKEPVRRFLRSSGLGPAPERIGHRMPLRAEQLRVALRTAPRVDAFDQWVRVDRRQYRYPLADDELRAAVRNLRGLDADLDARRRGVESLSALPWAAPAVLAGGGSGPLFRVPLLLDGREAVARELAGHGVDVHYVYDPPLDDYAGREFCEPSPDPEPARWWARHVLPIDPLAAGRFLRLVDEGRLVLRHPAAG